MEPRNMLCRVRLQWRWTKSGCRRQNARRRPSSKPRLRPPRLVRGCPRVHIHGSLGRSARRREATFAVRVNPVHVVGALQGSLIPDTLKLMEEDQDFQINAKRLKVHARRLAHAHTRAHARVRTMWRRAFMGQWGESMICAQALRCSFLSVLCVCTTAIGDGTEEAHTGGEEEASPCTHRP